jgi:hypothetical protein
VVKASSEGPRRLRALVSVEEPRAGECATRGQTDSAPAARRQVEQNGSLQVRAALTARDRGFPRGADGAEPVAGVAEALTPMQRNRRDERL